jgi:hypothetical protein
MRRTHLYLALIVAGPLTGLAVWLGSASRAGPSKPPSDEAPRSRLPLAQVVLFNTGVGYFQREGNVEGDARVDLVFPLSDVNDLLKSLTLEDGGKLGAVSYDSTEPVEHTLRSFAMDLNGNPTFGQILNQARGEKVEVTLEGAGGAAGSTVNGIIVGMEAQVEAAAKEVHHLNITSSEGMRRLPLARIARVRFLDPGLDEEFRRALALLSAGHSSRRRSLSLHLKGEGKRDVKIGYVVESPIWKASYRLVLDGKGGKGRVTGWAVIENASDEDWKGVRMVLVSGRPITFEMDLSQPLYIPRPPLEPQVYASPRPPTHTGVMPSGSQLGGGIQIGGAPATNPRREGVNLGVAGGGTGLLESGFQRGAYFNRYQILPPAPDSRRLSYQELVARNQAQSQHREQARHRARQMGSLIAGRDESIEAIAVDADRIGESFRYSLDQKVNLPRKKSALLPVADSAVQLSRLSIYNKAVHPRFPLLGVKLKNTSGLHLQQGPAAVFDAGFYVGDSRLPDLQPGQERLISYAMDLGLEVRDVQNSTTRRASLSIVKGVVEEKTVTRITKTYRLNNRSKTDRDLVLEHPINRGWSLIRPARPEESNEELYRFAWKVPAGKTIEQAVVEEMTSSSSQDLLALDDEPLKQLILSPGLTKALKDALGKVVRDRRALGTVMQELVELRKHHQVLTAEQDKQRLHLEKLPANSAAQKRALEKFDKLDAKLDKLQEQIRDRLEAVKKQQQQLDSYAKGLNIE